MKKNQLITLNIKGYKDLNPDFVKVIITKMPPFKLIPNTIVSDDLMCPNKILFKKGEDFTQDDLDKEYEEYLLSNCSETLELLDEALVHNDVYIIDYSDDYDKSLRKVVAKILSDMGNESIDL